jgi:hypothetical protein
MNVNDGKRTGKWNRRALGLGVLAIALFFAAPAGLAQNGQAPSQQGPTAEGALQPGANEAPEKHTWTIDQLVPLTVAQAWQKSGRNEDRFFDMVQDLAAFSAKNRNLVLPQSEEAGRQAGEYIKQQAKADPQQLLYVIVDRAVRKVATPANTGPGQAAK